MDKLYRIVFHSGENGFEIESTDKDWIESKEKEYIDRLIQSPTSNSVKSNQLQDLSTVTISTQLTINEFYKKYVSKVKKRPTIAVLFVYYLQRIQKMDSIKTGDVAKCFGDVSYPNYNKLNYTDILNNAKKGAFLNYVNNLWTLTITGEDFVFNYLTTESDK